METIIVYLDDAEYAQPLLESMSQSPRAADTQWVVVACAPRITHRVSKFVSNRTRENWRSKWAAKLFAETVPLLERRGLAVRPLLARGPLAELQEQLRQELGHSPQIVDLRRPKLENQALEVHAFEAGKLKLQTGRAVPSFLASLLGVLFLVEELAF